jgi:uncharacterized protein YbjQ (UPF0145 family)
MDRCPTCKASFKDGLLSPGAFPIIKASKELIEEYLGKQSDLCSKCGRAKLDEAKKLLSDETKELKETIEELIQALPIITIVPPLNWDYEVLNIVGGTVAMGTGFFSELSGSVVEATGTNSGALRAKLLKGERQCQQQVIKECMALGGNGVIGAAIDYDEIGGGIKGIGMLVVKIFGTAIRLKNLSVLGEERASKIAMLYDRMNRLDYLRKYKNM